MHYFGTLKLNHLCSNIIVSLNLSLNIVIIINFIIKLLMVLCLQN